MKKMMIAQTTLLLLTNSLAWGQTKPRILNPDSSGTQVNERQTAVTKNRKESDYRISSHDLTILNRNIDSLPHELTSSITAVALKSAQTKTNSYSYFDQRDKEGMLILYGKQDSLRRDSSKKLWMKDGYTDRESKLVQVLKQKYQTTLLKKVVQVSESIKTFSFQISVKPNSTQRISHSSSPGEWSSSFRVEVKNYIFIDLDGNEVKGGDFLAFDFAPEFTPRLRNEIKETVLNQIERRRFSSDIYSLAVESLGLTLPL